MKEIVELNKRILIEAPGLVPEGEQCFFVSREGGGGKEINLLPPDLKAVLDELCYRINALVPNDFSYTLFLGDYNPGMILEFCDGAMSRASCGESFDPNRSIIEQLEKVDWENHRSKGMSASQFFDNVRSLAAEIEPELPPAADIQPHFPHELEVFSKAKRNGSERIHLLKWRDDEGVTENNFVSMKVFRGELIDIMTFQYDLIAMIVDRKLLPPRKIDKIKRQTLVDLKGSMPISFTKAMRVFNDPLRTRYVQPHVVQP